MDKEEIRETAEAIVEELTEFDDGSVTTISKVMESIGCDPSECSQEDLFAVAKQVHSIAKKRHVSIKQAEEDTIGPWPWSVNLVVRNKKAQIKCPRCGSTNTARYLFGMPAYSEEMQKKLDSKKLILGGCCIDTVDVNGNKVWDVPGRKCNDCKKDFGRPPLINRDGQTAEDYLDVIESVEFSVYGNIGSDCFEVFIKKMDSGADVTVRKGFDEKTGHITDRRWYALLVSLLYDCYLFDWKKNYKEEDVYIMDGTSWVLELGLTGGRKRSWRGDNVFPPYWDETLRVFKSIDKCIKKIEWMSYEEVIKRNTLRDYINEIKYCKKVLNNPDASDADKEAARKRIEIAEEGKKQILGQE